MLGVRQESSNRSHGYLITKEKHHFDESRLSVKLLFYFHRTDPTRQTVFTAEEMNIVHIQGQTKCPHWLSSRFYVISTRCYERIFPSLFQRLFTFEYHRTLLYMKRSMQCTLSCWMHRFSPPFATPMCDDCDRRAHAVNEVNSHRWNRWRRYPSHYSLVIAERCGHFDRLYLVLCRKAAAEWNIVLDQLESENKLVVVVNSREPELPV